MGKLHLTLPLHNESALPVKVQLEPMPENFVVQPGQRIEVHAIFDDDTENRSFSVAPGDDSCLTGYATGEIAGFVDCYVTKDGKRLKPDGTESVSIPQSNEVRPQLLENGDALSALHKRVGIALAVHPLLGILVAAVMPGGFTFSKFVLSLPLLAAIIVGAGGLIAKRQLNFSFGPFLREMMMREPLLAASPTRIAVVLVFYTGVCIFSGIQEF